MAGPEERAQFQASQHEATLPAEAEAGPSQGLGSILRESAEETEQGRRPGRGERCSGSNSRAAADKASPCGPAARLCKAGSRGTPTPGALAGSCLPGVRLSCRKDNQ